jgi:hypothetical protein
VNCSSCLGSLWEAAAVKIDRMQECKECKIISSIVEQLMNYTRVIK